MKRLMVFLFVIAFCSLVPALLYSQYVDTAWVRRYNGPGNNLDEAHAIAVDPSGNVYVTGQSVGSGTSDDYATIKYNSTGIQQWVQRYNGPGNDSDYANAIAVDGQSNVYATGFSVGSGTFYDYATVKYNSAGAEQWVQRYNGPGNDDDRARAIAVDPSGNVYVTGYSYGSSSTSGDYATIKYDSAGVQQWVQRYNGPGNDDDEAYAIAVDGSGNVYVTGESYGSGTSSDYATIKYNSIGDTVWTRRYNGPGNYIDYANAIAVDGSGNVYVTGESGGDYVTIKYNSLADTVWVRRYDGPAAVYDVAHAIALDNSGYVYVTGISDFDPCSYADYATIKYNSVGIQEWVQRYDGQGNSDDYATAIAVDGSGNVYVTGWSNSDYATIKYVQTPGVEEIASLPLAKTQGFEVYPNPAKTYFNIRSSLFALHSTLKLYDVTGKIVKSEELKGKNNRIPLDGIKNGVYFVKINNNNQVTKLIVTK